MPGLLCGSVVQVSTAVPIAFGVLGLIGLIMFVAIGVSRHPKAYKVRTFGALVAGVFVVSLLVGVVSRHHQKRPALALERCPHSTASLTRYARVPSSETGAQRWSPNCQEETCGSP